MIDLDCCLFAKCSSVVAYCAVSCRVVIDNDSCGNATVIRVSEIGLHFHLGTVALTTFQNLASRTTFVLDIY